MYTRIIVLKKKKESESDPRAKSLKQMIRSRVDRN